MSYYSQEQCESPLGFAEVISIVVVFCISGMAWAYRNFRKVTKINLRP